MFRTKFAQKTFFPAWNTKSENTIEYWISKLVFSEIRYKISP